MSDTGAPEDEVLNDENETVDEGEQLQKELEKQIGKFARLFAMLDSDSGSEAETALRMLKSNMRKINELQEKLTGASGDLNFVTLLGKIENGGGGADVSEYEQLIADYQAANEQLKQAEEMLRGELERYKLIHKYSDEREPEKVNLAKLARGSLKDIRESLAKLDKMVNPAENTADDMYDNLLDEMLSKDLGANGEKPTLSHRMVGGILRGMNYPIDADDAVKLQAITQAQAVALKQTAELQTKLDVIGETLPALADALDLVIYRSGEHPDIARAINEMKSAMRTADRLQAQVEEQAKEMSEMRASHAAESASWRRRNESLTRQIERMDTRMLELCNYILDGGKNPIGRKDDGTGSKKKKSADERMEELKQKALDWSNPEAMKARIKAVEQRDFRMRAGTSFNTVTVDEIMSQNHKLNKIAQFVMQRDGVKLSAEDQRVIDAYTLLPRNEVEKIIESHARLESENSSLHGQLSSTRSQLSAAQGTASQMSQDISKLRQEKSDLDRDNLLLTAERDLYKDRVRQMQTANIRTRLTSLFVGLAAGAALTGAVAFATADHDEAPQTDRTETTQTVPAQKSILRFGTPEMR
jgi:hypothetical protein